MDRHIFNLKFAAKEMLRNSKRCEKLEIADKEKCRKAIKQGNMEGARIHAENSIRQRNQALNYLRMNSRLDGAASRIQNAVTMHQVTRSMGGIVQSMDVALQNMNLEQVSMLMDKFEQQSEEVDVQVATMDSSMGQTAAAGIPLDQVNQLIAQIADQAGLELNLALPQEGTSTLGTSALASSHQDTDLESKLHNLRNL